MDFNNILKATALMGGMGLAFGAILAVFGRIFHVESDPRRDEVREALPGANCGGCGHPGCDAYADAVAAGGCAVDLCPVGGEPVAQALASIMGVSIETREKLICTVRCRGGLDRCNLRFVYNGPKDCKSASLAAGGDKACEYSCLGYGDCEAACPFGAIYITKDRLAVVDAENCVGCGVCVAHCPRGVLQMMTASHPVHRACSAHLSGKVVRAACKAGCIGCGRCKRACKFDALEMINQLPDIDFSKCRACMQCVDSCPTGAIMAFNDMRSHAMIHIPDCIGCGRCDDICKFDAINVGADGRRSVIEWNCVGCDECAEVCPKECIEMRVGHAFR